MAAPALTVPPFTPPSYVVGAGGQTVFPFAFPFWDDDDIIVRVAGVVLDPSFYTVTGYFTQAGALVSGGYGSGQVALDAPVFNVTLTVDRFVEGVRDAVYGAGQPIPVSALNADFNRLVAMVQDLQRAIAAIDLSNLGTLIDTHIASALVNVQGLER